MIAPCVRCWRVPCECAAAPVDPFCTHLDPERTGDGRCLACIVDVLDTEGERADVEADLFPVSPDGYLAPLPELRPDDGPGLLLDRDLEAESRRWGLANADLLRSTLTPRRVA